MAKDTAGTGIGWKVVKQTDIPARMRDETKQYAELVQAAVDNHPDGILLTDLRGRQPGNVQSGIAQFSMRHPELRQGFHIKVSVTARGVYVLAIPEEQYLRHPRGPNKKKGLRPDGGDGAHDVRG